MAIRPLILAAALCASGPLAAQEKNQEKIAIDPESGLAIAPGFPIVKAYCTACHSAKLVSQAGKTRAGWIESIRWMQRTQGLFDLGEAEGEILDYLAGQYGIRKQAGGMLQLPPLASQLMPPLPPPRPDKGP